MIQSSKSSVQTSPVSPSSRPHYLEVSPCSKAMFSERRVRKDVYKPFPIWNGRPSKQGTAEGKNMSFHQGKKMTRSTPALKSGQYRQTHQHWAQRKPSLVFSCYQSNNGTLPVIHPPATPAEEGGTVSTHEDPSFDLDRDSTRLILQRVDRLLMPSLRYTQQMVDHQPDGSSLNAEVWIFQDALEISQKSGSWWHQSYCQCTCCWNWWDGIRSARATVSTGICRQYLQQMSALVETPNMNWSHSRTAKMELNMMCINDVYKWCV